ncbi:hypothetical protein N7448_010983 [Penicillium atrosanguineum]|nr:hypothetical protein N7448_010983 [Penicillium atrosanguineum]
MNGCSTSKAIWLTNLNAVRKKLDKQERDRIDLHKIQRVANLHLRQLQETERERDELRRERDKLYRERDRLRRERDEFSRELSINRDTPRPEAPEVKSKTKPYKFADPPGLH